MYAHTSPNGSTETSSNPSPLDSTQPSLANIHAQPISKPSTGVPMGHSNFNLNPFTNEHDFFQQQLQQLQQQSTPIEQDLSQQHNVTLSQLVQRVKSVSHHTTTTTRTDYELTPSLSPRSFNCGNELSPISSKATRTPNSTNSTPLLSQDNVNICDPTLVSNTPPLQLSNSCFVFDLQPNHHENLSMLYGVCDSSLGTIVDDQDHALSADQRNASASADREADYAASNEQNCQAKLHQSHYHQLERLILSGGESALNSQILGGNSPSSRQTNKDHAASVNQPNPSNQQTLHTTSSNQSHISTPGSSIDQINRKRLNDDQTETNSTTIAPTSKMTKRDATRHQHQNRDTEPTSKFCFTAASFENMTRNQMVNRLVILENERIDLLGILEDKDVLVMDSTLGDSGATGKSNKTTFGNYDYDVDDDDDDDDEGTEIVPSTADANLDSINSNNLEMKCLWKNCGATCIGGPGLTDHIIATHIGNGKPLYRCEWENCQRNQKPFTKRHKLCNHLRRHSGERPFVCDKPGCDKRFSRPDYLITHIKTHSNVRPFVCHISGCDKAYYHARSLKKHLKLHDEQNVNNNNDGTTDNIILSTSYASNITAVPTGIQPTQQQEHIYSLDEQLALSQFALYSASNSTTATPFYDPSHSLFDPLVFQDLSSIQTYPLPQQQFTQMNPSSHISMVGVNTNVNTMNESNYTPSATTTTD